MIGSKEALSIRGRFLGIGLLVGTIVGAAIVFLLPIPICISAHGDYGPLILYDGMLRRLMLGALLGGLSGMLLMGLPVKLSMPARRLLRAAICVGFLLWGVVVTLPHERRARALWEAVSRGDSAAVKTLLDQGADVDAHDWYSEANWDDDIPNTIFMLAVQKGNRAIVQEMLHHRVNLNAASQYGDTALMWAAQEGHGDLVTLLVSRGADVQARNTSGETTLMQAAYGGDTAACRCLIDHGVAVNASDNVGYTALMKAAEEGHDAVIELLLARGARLDAADSSGDTAINLAAEKGHPSTVRLLRDRGLKPGIFEAAVMGDADVLNALLKSGSSIDQHNRQGRTPLMIAAVCKNAPVVRLLKASGADINAVDEKGQTALMLIAGESAEDDPAMIETLLQCGANIDATDNQGETALIHHASFGRTHLVQALLRHHANTARRNREGRTALDCARQFDHQETVEAMVKMEVKR